MTASPRGQRGVTGGPGRAGGGRAAAAGQAAGGVRGASRPSTSRPRVPTSWCLPPPSLSPGQRGARTRHHWTLRRGFEAVTQPCRSSAPSRRSCGASSHPSARSHPALNSFTATQFFSVIISLHTDLYFCTCLTNGSLALKEQN